MNTETLSTYDSSSFLTFTSKMTFDRDIKILMGMVEGIRSDNIVHPLELAGIHKWMDEMRKQSSREPYRSIVALLREVLEDSIITEEEKKDIIWLCKQYLDDKGYFGGSTACIQQLLGLVKGITLDNTINEAELRYLDQWLEGNVYLKNSYPYDELYNLITRITKDKVFSHEEHSELLRFCQSFTSDSSSNAVFYDALKAGQCQIDPDIIIPGQNFCLTGISKKFKRKEIAERIELYGGIVRSGVSAQLNYLVVCDDKNSCWTFSCYGRKVEQTLTHRRSGVPIVIVHELDLYDAFEDLNIT